jgi:hypothetical protein
MNCAAAGVTFSAWLIRSPSSRSSAELTAGVKAVTSGRTVAKKATVGQYQNLKAAAGNKKPTYFFI